MAHENAIMSFIKYDPTTGLFYRRRATSGGEAGSLIPGGRMSDGSVRIKVGAVAFLARRVAWLLVTGEWPKYEIVHRNGDKSDNRFENLCHVTAVERPKSYKTKIARRGDLTASMVRELLNYEPETGRFIYKRDVRRIKSGSEAGCIEPKNGYRIIGIRGHNYHAHRLAWLVTHGHWPKEQIDHINGTPADNRIANLREATPSQNMWNSARPKNNTSGVKGVSWSAVYSKWAAAIKVERRNINLGMFATKQEAAEAYRAAARKFHGEFARFD